MPSESALEIRLLAESIESLSHQRSMNTDTQIQQVFVLLHTSKKGKKTTPIVFDALPKLHQHVIDLVVKDIKNFEDRHQVPLLRFAEGKLYDNFFRLWRYLQSEKLCGADFDLHWENKPQVVL